MIGLFSTSCDLDSGFEGALHANAKDVGGSGIWSLRMAGSRYVGILSGHFAGHGELREGR
jgi:hypothetical protein